MQHNKTLTLKKPANPRQDDQHKPKSKPENDLVGKEVVLQTRSPSRITGTLISLGGWAVIEGAEQRWLPDGSLSGQVASGRFSLDRNVIAYVLEVL